MRPRGEIAIALLDAFRVPGTVSQAAERAQVGYAAARYTATRLVDRGELRVLEDTRPAVLVAADALPDAPPELECSAAPLDAVVRSFWERPLAEAG